ncbi:MAG: OmpA family protein [Campylobacterota bacterium]|nr:OmpA family protein [Campylobacterota bacterium]
MFQNNQSDSDSNFWISYADLMAGLLFVFILLIGAIVSKSSILKEELHEKNNSLANSLALIEKKENTLLTTNKKLSEKSDALKESLTLLSEKESYILKRDKLLAAQKEEMAKTKANLSQKEKALQEENARLAQSKLLLSDNERVLKLKLKEIDKLNKMLLDANMKADTLNGKIVVLSNELSDAKDSVKIKDEKLLTLLTAMDDKKTKYDDLIANFQKQKAKIKSLTGMKLQVLSSLKKALGSKINIDKKTGSLKLASNIFFSVGQATLKEEAKVELKSAFEEYIGTLVKDENIRPHLSKIIIEGHTDSDGGYIYNLQLSQNRALAVMSYLLTLDFSKKYNIQPLMTASGRAYLDPIEKNGVEDKEASRRIEIKFRLKNEDAMNEIEKVLDAE